MDILLVRHGETPANVDPQHYLEVADHAVGLTDLGESQATAAGRFAACWIADNWAGRPMRIWNSPYARTRRTAELFAAELAARAVAFDRREHILLAEQQFGLFDGLADEVAAARYPDEWEHYERCRRHDGRFWARMPLGESRFDVSVRVHQAFGTFHRDAERHGIDRLVVVAHGTTLRAFATMWLHKPFEWFEAEPNPQNCSIRRITDDVDHGYIWQPDT